MIQRAHHDLSALFASLPASVGVGRLAPRTLGKAASPNLPGIAAITSRVAFEALGAEWRALERQAPGAILFQSFDWCRTVWDHHESQGQAFDPLILTLRERGSLVGVLPLQRVGPGRARIATGFGEPYQQYSDAILAPDAPADTAERLLLAACRLSGCGGLQLLKLRDDSPLAPVLQKLGALLSNPDAAPFVDLSPFADFAAYRATVNAKTRKNMRNARNRLARSGALTHTMLSEAVAIESLVERAHAGRERWLAEQGLTSRAFRDASFMDFARRAAAGGAGLQTLVMSLALDGQPVADQWGFVFNGRYYAYVASWTPGFEESSPGKLHLEEVIHACHARGIRVADFLMPAARYKFTWTDEAMPVADYALPLSLAARLRFRLWSGLIRPRLKQLALALPPALRGRIARALLPRH
jgi:CelD/BcsL family acetyltransferase involved in cellulose biosynthesis